MRGLLAFQVGMVLAGDGEKGWVESAAVWVEERVEEMELLPASVTAVSSSSPFHS